MKCILVIFQPIRTHVRLPPFLKSNIASGNISYMIYLIYHRKFDARNNLIYVPYNIASFEKAKFFDVSSNENSMNDYIMATVNNTIT